MESHNLRKMICKNMHVWGDILCQTVRYKLTQDFADISKASISVGVRNLFKSPTINLKLLHTGSEFGSVLDDWE